MSENEALPSVARDDKYRAEAEKLRAETAAAATRAAAETEKLMAESRQAAAETKKIQAEALEAREKARQEELKTRISEFNYDREREKRDRELADFRKQRVYHFTDAVKDESCAKCMTELNFWHAQEPKCDIEVMFDSPGGSVFAGLALYDYIQELRRKGHRVTTATRGMAASMAGILLQAGDHRAMGAESWILIHEVSTGAFGKIGEIEDEVELVKKVQERVLDIFASRSSLSKATFRRRWRRKDWWISSTDAEKWGLVDEVR